MRGLAALSIFILATSSMAQGLFLQSHNEQSSRFAVLEDNERVAYLYLTKPGKLEPEKDAIAYLRVKPVDRVDWEAIKRSGDTPMLTRELATASAVIEKPVEREFSFKWSRDGNAVALLHEGTPIAFACASDELGYSKAVSKTSSYANAWDQLKYESLFSK
jgi:hypothetical protein